MLSFDRLEFNSILRKNRIDNHFRKIDLTALSERKLFPNNHSNFQQGNLYDQSKHLTMI